MRIEQMYTGCLAEAAYYIESNGEVAIVDPLREVQPYIDKARENGAQIKYIFETHFHADFVSGHKTLAEKTGATIVYGPTTMETGFEKKVATDGEVFQLGEVTIEVLHTPGHTMESSCFLLRDEKGKQHGVFTGDTLFIGDVGRPDLAQKVIPDLTEEKLAGYLYDSLRTKIMTLPDEVIVYPGHGRGSACGKNMSSETIGTIGDQKATNYALRPDMDREEFKKELLEGLTPPPGYFPKNVLLNIQGYESIDSVLERGVKALTPAEFEFLATETDALILDTRSKDAFRESHIPGSIFIGIDGSFASWVGILVPDLQQEILFISEEGREEEVVTRLARVGYDHAIGFLNGGISAWEKEGRETDTIESMSAEELSKEEEINILDVRKASEFQAEHVVGALNAPLDYINESMLKVGRDTSYFVHCLSGYRSMIFISILRARGYHKLVDIKGGFKALKAQGDFKLSDYVCQSTML